MSIARDGSSGGAPGRARDLVQTPHLTFNPMVDNRPIAVIFNHMVDKHPDRLDALFRALADPTRRAMLRALSTSPRTVGELAAPFDISLAGASKHVQALERAGLVQREVQGRVHTCRLDARPLHTGAEWIRHYERFWNSRLDALEGLLRADAAPQRRPPAKAGATRVPAAGKPESRTAAKAKSPARGPTPKRAARARNRSKP